MPVTRDQASRLLTQAEMGLFGDSRNPALRALTASGLGKRIERVRKLRDKSRDLLQRQRLSSRDRSGSKLGASGEANERTRRKGEVLADILQRFEARLKDVDRADKLEAKQQAAAASAAAKADAKAKTAAAKGKAAVGKTKAGKAAAASPRAKTAAGPLAGKAKSKGSTAAGPMAKTAGRAADTKAAIPTKAAPRSGASKAATADGAATTSNAGRGAVQTTSAKPKPKPAKRAAPAAITPKRALANTRALLKAKQQHDAEPKAWQALGGQAQHAQPDAGFQSGISAAKAEELHAGEIRMTAIEGSISTRGRQNQGKRDNR